MRLPRQGEHRGKHATIDADGPAGKRHRFRKQLPAANIPLCRQADIVECTLGEIPSGMAFGAAPLAAEHFKAARRLGRDGGRIALDPAIERRRR